MSIPWWKLSKKQSH